MSNVQGKFEDGKYTHPLVTVDADGKVEGYVKTMKEYFGLLPGQSIRDFGPELTALTLDEKVQLVGGIRDESLDYAVA